MGVRQMPTNGEKTLRSEFAKTGIEEKPQWIILVAVVVLTLFFYWLRCDTLAVTNESRGWFNMTGATMKPVLHNLGAGFLLGLLPLVGIRVLAKRPWSEMGLGKGCLGSGVRWLGFGIPVAILAGYVSSGDVAMRAVYPLDSTLQLSWERFVPHILGQLIYYTAWELLFRGILLNELTRRFGFANANIIQTALSVVAHFGRPFTETFAAIPGGLAFGGVARRTGSIWYVVLIHWTVGVAQDWFILRSLA